ncbi:MAG: ketopantoate reductase C-terminal domain-containing protein [Myxococcota bacterium]
MIPPTAAHESSMLQDLRAARQTEIEALCGAVERLAEKHGIQTPVVSALARLVRAAQSHKQA